MVRVARLSYRIALTLYSLLALVVFANIVGAELGCATWPVCGASSSLDWLSPTASLLATLMVVGAAAYGWLAQRDRVWVVRPTLLAVLLVALLVGVERLGGFGGAPWLAPVRLALAMLVMALLLVAVMADRIGAPVARRDAYPRLLLGLTAASYGLILTGALVVSRNVGAALPEVVRSVHQVSMVGMGLMLAVLVWSTYRVRRGTRLVPGMIGVGSLFVLQAVFGLGFLWLGVPLALRVAHLAFGVMVWGGLVALTMLAYATPVLRRDLKVSRKAAVEAVPPTSLKATVSAYVALAKPRVISLLLLTTWAAMWIASPTPPSLSLVFWTLLGGALAAGGANAINMYYDRDIDELMGRTARRPLPSHRLAPLKALWFGIALGVLSFVSLTVFVNLLSAVLALAGLLFYVFIYTAWLKRTSTQNIVIGGAAGAVPPLVGWAAVTGQLSLIPVYLFIIVFFWTPPHFWALALVRQGDYSRAGVPMLPCVVGERETYKQIVIYSVVLVALSLVFGPLSGMGMLYLALALLLGGVFIWDAVKLAQQGGAAPAWKLYKYSLLYLALLFVAMMLDHSLAGSLPASPTAFLRP